MLHVLILQYFTYTVYPYLVQYIPSYKIKFSTFQVHVIERAHW